MDTKFLVEAPETIDYIPGETQLPNSREYVEKTLSDISEELTEKLHEEGVVNGTEFAKLVKNRLYGEDFHEMPYLDPDICYEQYKEMEEMVIDPLSGQIFHVSTAGFGKVEMLDRMIEQLAMKAGQKMFLNYIYGIDPAEGCREYIRQTWEMIISPLWSETLYRVRPIDIQKGGWKCRIRTRLGSIPAHGAETQRSIQ